MFWNRLRKTNKLIEHIVIFHLDSTSGDPVVEYVYPSVNNENSHFHRLRNFVVPCKHKSLISEEYTLIFTDSDGTVEFFACITLPISGYIVCISSYFPYFELLHSIITLINQEHLYREENRRNIEVILKELHYHSGVATLNISSPPNSTKLIMQLPEAQFQFVYHRHILEYYNTLSIGNWIVIFESLILEKSVIFYSSRLHRITSCLLASLSLLYPLIWPHLIYSLLPSNCIEYVGCPTPFVAGVHSCLKEKMKPLLIPGVRLVDLDHDVVYGTGDVGITMPSVLRHWLIKRCNASHSAILRHIRSTENVASTAALLLARPYLELMAILLGRYRSALQHNEASSSVDLLPIQSPNDDSRSQDKFDQPRIGGWFFDRAAFVVSCGHELQPYLTELLNSQMVIQFFESRVAVLNSDMAFIPPDDFEDIIDHVSIPRRSGGLNDLLNFGRTEFDKITRKLTQKSEKLSQKFVPRPNNLYQTFKLNSSTMQKRNFSNSATSKAHSRKVLIPSLSTRPSEQDICEILRKKLEFKKDNNLSLPTHYQQNNDTNNLPSCDNSIWQPLSPKIDHELRNSERTNRSLLTSILSELPDLTADFYPSTTSRVNDSQVSLRNRSQDIEHKPFNLRCNSSKRMGCYVESPEKAFHNWVTFDSSPPTCSSEDLINLTGSPPESSNTLDPFSDDSFSKSLSTNTKPAKCDHNELEQAILDEFDQLSKSRIRKT
ncbi:unnamed protein product [Schistosoma intercalatum]|nr:unnamed protein product [Schistosoma intercalatum]CAH8482210.1 unnamed protein product [Schistosoma intercalatum]